MPVENTGHIEEESSDSTDFFTLNVDSEGKIFCASQLMDYQFRGTALENCCVLDFFVETYEEDIGKTSTGAHTKDVSMNTVQGDFEHYRQRGRPRNERIRYLEGHPRAKDKCRVRRSDGHRNLPNLVGSRIPRNDDGASSAFYSASVLLLLKPWRQICDLKPQNMIWSECLENTLQMSPRKGRLEFVISALQYYHECLSAASEARPDDIIFDDDAAFENCDMILHSDQESGGFYIGDDDKGLTEGRLASLQTMDIAYPERIHAIHAVGCAKYAGIFKHEDVPWIVVDGSAVSRAIGDDFQLLEKWKQQMAQDVIAQNNDMDINVSGVLPHGKTDRTVEPSVRPSSDVLLDTVQPGSGPSSLNVEEALSPIPSSSLKQDQLRAYNIIIQHLDDTLADRDPPHLRMILYGEGGTGKSKVIQTVTQAFIDRGAKHLLVKAAYTGVAASLIDGKTTHSLASLGLKTDRGVSQAAKKKLQAFWNNKRYLIVDEYSMIGKTFLANLSKHIAIGKVGSSSAVSDASFGGVNVILCGDLHQFPPVAQSLRESLFRPPDLVDDTFDRKIGRGIYEEFKTVVILKEQMRVSDPLWHAFLTRLRHGRIREDDISMLKGLVLGEEVDRTDFSQPPWSDSLLVTPRHAVRLEWNRCAVRKHCVDTGEQLFVCLAEDKIAQRTFTLAEKYAVAQRKKDNKGRKTKGLPREVELAKGMKVLVTTNLETDLDITNGARGTIVDIKLHPDESLSDDGPIFKLKLLPVCILVKLDRTRASKLDGLEERVIPIEAICEKFEIKIKNSEGKVLRRTVHRRQFPVTPAYAFTDIERRAKRSRQPL